MNLAFLATIVVSAAIVWVLAPLEVPTLHHGRSNSCTRLPGCTLNSVFALSPGSASLQSRRIIDGFNFFV